MNHQMSRYWQVKVTIPNGLSDAIKNALTEAVIAAAWQWEEEYGPVHTLAVDTAETR